MGLKKIGIAKKVLSDNPSASGFPLLDFSVGT